MRRATTQVPDGAGWADATVRYYRYYQPEAEHGFPHGLKYVVGREPYARMLQDGLEPLEEPDAVVAQYADQYLEYDGQQRVTREVRDGGGRSYTFEYTASAHSEAYDHWKIKTVETRPDGSEHIVYTNCIGQILIKKLRAGSQRWIESRAYDTDGRQIERARPSAVVDYDDGYDAATGARVQTIQDVDTSQVGNAPAGWTTPAGGGLQTGNWSGFLQATSGSTELDQTHKTRDSNDCR